MPAQAGMVQLLKTRGIMDNFHFIDIKPTIDRSETASIKDAIFKRAREKAQQITEEKSENYTSQVQNDVMDIARESIQASPMNPFNQFMENVGLQNKITEAIDKVKPKEEMEEKVQPKQSQVQNAKQEIGQTDFDEVKFAENFTREVKRNIESASNQAFVKSVQEETMASARNQFRTNLNYTLSFLNTQAAIKAAESAHSKINFMI